MIKHPLWGSPHCRKPTNCFDIHNDLWRSPQQFLLWLLLGLLLDLLGHFLLGFGVFGFLLLLRVTPSSPSWFWWKKRGKSIGSQWLVARKYVRVSCPSSLPQAVMVLLGTTWWRTSKYLEISYETLKSLFFGQPSWWQLPSTGIYRLSTWHSSRFLFPS